MKRTIKLFLCSWLMAVTGYISWFVFKYVEPHFDPPEAFGWILFIFSLIIFCWGCINYYDDLKKVEK